MMKHILVLEDLDYIVDGLLSRLGAIESDCGDGLKVSVYTTSREVEQIVNEHTSETYDVIILDRNAPDGTFHVLDIDKFGPEKIISISSVDSFNQKLKKRGVKHTVHKRHEQLDHFFDEVERAIRDIL